MALIGIDLNRTNPAFTSADFTFWMPQYSKYITYYEGRIVLNSIGYTTNVYSSDYSNLTIGTHEVTLSTSDNEIYTGSLTISQITFSITLNTITMQLTAVGNEISTTCILKSEGNENFKKLYEIANAKIFKSIYGTDWKLAMSLCIAHYLTIISRQQQAPSGNTLSGIAGGATHGVLSDATIGAFSKHYDLSKTMVDEEEALFWNQTSFGSDLMALLKTKAIPSILVVTSNPIYQCPPCHRPGGIPWID